MPRSATPTRSVPALIRAQPALVAGTEYRCQMCGVLLGGNHRHVVDDSSDTPLCACRRCSQLYASTIGVTHTVAHSHRDTRPGHPAAS